MTLLLAGTFYLANLQPADDVNIIPTQRIYLGLLNMRIHVLQHVPFEDIGSIRADILHKGHTLTTTHWYKGDNAPELNSFDVLVVMGGPMGVYDDGQYPWLAEEKKFIANAMAAQKKILGICLGAQLIACVAGAKVSRNLNREIGWFPLVCESEHPLANILRENPRVFHWHGDTFAIPQGAELIASSAACKNQAFVIGNNILALQFHLETTPESAGALVEHCGNELDDSRFVQTASAIINAPEQFAKINITMSKVWEYFLAC